MTKVGAMAFLSLAALAVSQADAQSGERARQAEATGSSSLEAAQPEVTEVVVTARRRSERLIDVPVAVSVHDGARLEEQGATNLANLSEMTPNVTIEPSRNTSSTIAAFIRGVGQQDSLPGLEAGVGIYVDDVYLARPQAALLDIYDVERIEVLRGPQGTLYGRNTIGGAAKYVTRKLGPIPELRMRATVGSYEQADVIITSGAPVNDFLRVGGTVARLSRGGFGKNLTTGEDNYDKDVWAGRFSLEINNGGALFVRLAGDYTKDRSHLPGMHRLIPGYASGAPVLDDVFDTRAGNVDPRASVEAGGVSLLGELAFSGVTFKSITAWRKDRSYFPNDSDALATVESDTAAIYDNEQVSQEVQAVFTSGRWAGVAGAYYLDATAGLGGEGSRLFSSLPGLVSTSLVGTKTENVALFADVSYELTPKVSLSVGGRYTRDTRKADIFRQSYLSGTPLGEPATDFEGEKKFSEFTPRSSIGLKPGDNHNVYVSYAKGFKGGGFDVRGTGANAPDTNGNGERDQEEVASFLLFQPEIVDSYEAGYKGSLLDDRLYVALAAFRMDYSNVQIPGIRGCLLPGGVESFCGVTTNAGEAKIQGVELEANAQPARGLLTDADRLSVRGAVGYIDPKFEKYITNIGGQAVDVSRYRKFQNTPKWTASMTLSYDRPLTVGRIGFNTSVSYRSRTYQYEIPNPYIDQGGYTLLNASLVWERESWKVGLHGRNLLDKEYRTAGYTFLQADPLTGELLVDPETGRFIPQFGREGILTANYGDPRQIFLSVEYNCFQ